MRTFFFSAIALGLTLFGPLAYSNNGQKPGLALSFDELRAACLNPAKFHNQVAPTNIQVSCRDTQAKWVPATDGSINLPTEREVTTSVMSDKYSASTVSGAIRSAAQLTACPKFKQITETVEVVQAATCDELVAFSGSAIDYCVGAANALRTANPQVIASVDTGRVFNLCGQSPGQNPGQNSGQR